MALQAGPDLVKYHSAEGLPGGNGSLPGAMRVGGGLAALLCGALLGGMLVRRLSVGGRGGGGEDPVQLRSPPHGSVELLGGLVVSSSVAGRPGLQSFAVTVPEAWTPGSKLSVAVPRRGQVLLTVPSGVGRGQKFFFQLSAAPRGAALPAKGARGRLGAGARVSRPGLRMQRLNDLSLDGMLDFERQIRDSMGKLRNTWKKVSQSMLATRSAVQHFDDANFISVKDAPKEKGWNPKNPNGFPARRAGVNDTNGVPGYTYALNGEDLGVADQGPGYYQPIDPEHNLEYLSMLRTDCFVSKAKWRDHSNCAALVRRSRTYPNDDPFRFSGAFGWNPPFPNGTLAVNKRGATAPGENSYWNYGSDEDIAGAALWDGQKFLPPTPPPEEEGASEEGHDEGASE